MKKTIWGQSRLQFFIVVSASTLVTACDPGQNFFAMAPDAAASKLGTSTKTSTNTSTGTDVATNPPTNPPANPPAQNMVCDSMSYVQRAVNDPITKLDTVFVVDTSGSMDDDYNQAADQIGNYIMSLPADLDMNFGVIYGRVDSSAGLLYAASGEPLVLKTTQLSKAAISASLKKTFASAMNVGSSGSEGEATFYALWRALERVAYTGSTASLKFNSADMFRPDAALSVIFISDENEVGTTINLANQPGLPKDCSASDENRVKTTYYDPKGINADSLVAKLKALKGDLPLTVNAIVNISVADVLIDEPGFVYNPASTTQCLSDGIGYGFKEAATAGGGVLYSIQEDFAVGLSLIGDLNRRKLELKHEFVVPLQPGDVMVESAANVTVDGADVAFQWNGATNVMTVPNAGDENSEVQINYCVMR